MLKTIRLPDKPSFETNDGNKLASRRNDGSRPASRKNNGSRPVFGKNRGNSEIVGFCVSGQEYYQSVWRLSHCNAASKPISKVTTMNYPWILLRNSLFLSIRKAAAMVRFLSPQSTYKKNILHYKAVQVMTNTPKFTEVILDVILWLSKLNCYQ